ncbi:hypothetical protein J2T13_000704 [Paenibacillus sp. DS2015]|uniref:hypothetical protein n=1 Tax=Paenibacillus sp. DS2015 TaxID=3373917 RepID=UPI003D1F7F8D
MNTILPDFHEIEEMFKKARQIQLLKPGSRIIVSPQIRNTDKVKQAVQSTEKLKELIFSLVDRFFGGDIEEMARWLGYPESILPWIRATSFIGERDDILLRSDWYEEDSVIKFLELNLGSSVGGVLLASLHSSLLTLSNVNDAIFKQDVFYINTIHEWAQNAYKLWLKHLSDPLMVFVESLASMPSMHETLHKMATVFSEVTGVRTIVCTPSELILQEDGIYTDGHKVDVIYRLFDLEDLESNPNEFNHILNAIEKKIVSMPMGFAFRILGNKALFSLLSDPEYHSAYSTDEIDWIRRHIPWTRIFNEKYKETAILDKEKLLLKLADGHGGEGVICGWEMSESDWESHVVLLLSTNNRTILQDRVYPTSGSIAVAVADGIIYEEQANFLWGCLLFSGKHIGHILRTKSIEKGSVINYSNGAAITSVFYNKD